MRGRPGGLTGSTVGQVYHFGVGNGDDGAGYDAMWDLPWRAIAGAGENTRVDAIESFFKQTPSAITAEIILLKSDTLHSDEGSAVTPQTIALESASKLRATYYDQQTRFVSVRHRLLNTLGSQQYKGGVLYVYSRGES